MKLQENEDYYFDNGLMVFTEKYHLKRGHCCGNGCRHCPYGYKGVKDEKERERLRDLRKEKG